MADHEARREAMVRQQIAARGLRDPVILAAFRAVPREDFVPWHWRPRAYRDGPIPIGEGQTISQPFVVAEMLRALGAARGGRVLEVGAGCGYVLALLAEIVGPEGEVFGVERIPALAEAARARLDRLGYPRVHLRRGDGARGWPERAPFDGILVSAAGPRIPPPLLAQLRPGARLVIPVGAVPEAQRLLRLTRRDHGPPLREDLGPVRFVPLREDAEG